ncbi:unnamed protein product [Plutella xylostella]|uniref:(diamondback moth) hypothetical protein n=1 Tax=Plutella xylostella TaxID=51655 RepID=A0A8S4CWA5_PLUXY|nr:unnamed protein product [Plutella xylostella]
MVHNYVVFVSVFIVTTVAQQHPIVSPFVQALHPRGLKFVVSDDNYTMVNIYGSVNQEIPKFQPGHLHLCSIRKPKKTSKSKAWVLRDNTVSLKIGDRVYFWLSVFKDDKEIRKMNEEFRVYHIYNEDGSKHINNPLLEAEPDTDVDACLNRECEDSWTEVQGRVAICKGNLVFNEDFSKAKSGLKNWTPEVYFPEGPDYPFNVYTVGETYNTVNGKLVIKPLLLDNYYHEGMVFEELDLTKICTGRLDTTECERRAGGASILPPVMTAKVTTRQRFSFKYGRVEVRAKLPKGDWLVPEINLEPRSHTYGNGRYVSGLIRVAFSPGNSAHARTLQAGPVLYSERPFRTALVREKVGSEEWYREYHNYTLLWNREGIKVYVNGENYGAVAINRSLVDQAKAQGVPADYADRWTSGTQLAPLDELFYISIGLRVGGSNDFPDDPGKPYKNHEIKAMLKFWEAKDKWLSTWEDASLKVDCVKVYAV